MRIAGLIAVSALLAGCSQSVGGEAEPSRPAAEPPTMTTSAPPPTTSAPPSASGAPAADASIDQVIGWIEGGQAADPAGFHVAFRDGVTTTLGEDIAFTAASGAPHANTQCVTATGSMTCLLELTTPPPPPAQAEGMWKPGWIDFTGTGLTVGALRGDPGPFVNGPGAELPAGQSLTFGDTRCRSDISGLFCVNYAHRSAVRLAADGVTAFGCLTEVPPAADAARTFSC